MASITTQFYRIISNNPQFIQNGQSGKDDVAYQRNNPQLPVQLPSIYMNGYKKEDDWEEERAGNEDQSSAVDLHRIVCVNKSSLDEPRQAQAQHVEYVGAHDVGHGHVSFPWWPENVKMLDLLEL